MFVELVLFIYFFSLFVRRLHDNGKSGWYLLWSFVPLVNLYLLVLLFYIPGNKKTNKFGSPNNKARLRNIFALES